MLGAFDPVRHLIQVRTSATKRSTDFVGLLDQLGTTYRGPERARPLVIVMDTGRRSRSADPHQQAHDQGAGRAALAHG
jgi:hypothetical protein